MERPRLVVRALVTAALVAEIIVGVFVLPHLNDTARSAGDGLQGAALGGYRNGAGGYTFSAPPSWRVSAHDAVSQARSKNGHALVAFAPIPDAGSASASAAQLVGLLRRSYEEFTLIDRRDTRLGHRSAVLIEGKAVNNGHVPVRLFAAEVRSRKGSLGVVGYWSSDASSAQRKGVRRTVRSLKA